MKAFWQVRTILEVKPIQAQRLALLVLFSALACGTEGLSSQDGVGRPAGTIPLESVYSTSGQKELKRLDRGVTLYTLREKKYAASYGADLADVYDHPSGASNVLLVTGRDIDEAIRAARWVFVRGRSVDSPVGPDGSNKSGPCWLVVYFGKSQSNPIEFRVESVVAGGKTVRITYSRPRPEDRQELDLWTYLVFAPLGQLEKATYQLELFDAGVRRASLARTVEVK